MNDKGISAHQACADQLADAYRKLAESGELTETAIAGVESAALNGETGFGKMKKGAKSLGVSLKAMGKAASAALMNMAIIWIISKAIELLVKVIDNAVHAEERAIERTKELTEEWEKGADVLKKQKKAVEDNGEENEKLSKGVNPLTNDNLTLNTDEYARYLELTNQIAS